MYTEGQALRLLDVRTGRSEVLLTVDDSEQIGTIRVTPDGSYIYFTIATSESDIWLAQFGGGR